MTIWEILLIGIALSMDAVAVSISDAVSEPHMPRWKALSIAGAFGLFQFLMPVIGYYCGYAFASLVEEIAPWLSFALLTVLGGKMIFESMSEPKATEKFCKKKSISAGQVLVQAIATSIDALAVGVTLLAAEVAQGLPDPVALCALLIGETTAVLSCLATAVGKRTGELLADRAETVGGAILLLIGIKILLQSFT